MRGAYYSDSVVELVQQYRQRLAVECDTAQA